MNRNLFGALIVLGALSMGIPASAGTISVSVVGNIDNLIASTNLGNSGDMTELDWVKVELGKLGVDTTGMTIEDKYAAGTGWDQVIGAGTAVYAHQLLDAPEYFLIKTGNVTPGDVARDFLFRNNSELDYAVISLLAMGYERIDKIRGISHIDEFGGGTKVPEPGTLMLLGSGLIGMAVMGRRQRRK
jgi:hypothetical protein